MLDPMIITLVRQLLGSSCPTAIAWFVIAIIVLAFQGVLGAWPFPHISQEIDEGISPSLADRYATTAIVGKFCVFSVKAPLLHQAPDSEFGRFRHAVLVRASTRFCVTRNQILSYDRRHFAAVTQATPCGLAANASVSGYNSEEIKRATGQFERAGHVHYSNADSTDSTDSKMGGRTVSAVFLGATLATKSIVSGNLIK